MKLQRTIFFSVLILLHVFFFLEAINNGHVFTKDSYEYLQQAKNIRDHHSWYCGDLTLPVEPALYSQRPPGYGVFIFFLKKINNNVWFLLFIQNLLSIFNFYLLYRLLNQLSFKSNLLWCFLPLLLFPSQFIYSNLIMSEMLLQTCVILSFYFLIQFILEKKIAALWLYQFFISIALLIKPVWYLFPFISILFFVFLITRKQFAKWTLVSHLVPLFFVAGIFIHNHNQTSYWEYSSIQRKLMVNYNVHEVLEHSYGEKQATIFVSAMQDSASQKMNYSKQAAFLQQEINKVLIDHPLSFAWIETKGVLRFFIDHCRYDIESFFKETPNQTFGWYDDFLANGWNGIVKHFKDYNAFYFLYLIFSVIANAILLLSLFIFSKQKSIDQSIRIILVVMIIYCALLTGPTGTTRFRLPIYLLLLFAFAFSLPVIMQWLNNRFTFKRKLT